MSLSDEAIYDIVAYVVSGETINPDSKPVPFSEYEYKCYSLAHHVWDSGFDDTAEALCAGISFGDRKRLLEDALAAMLVDGACAPWSGANNERAAHRRAVKARIEKLFGTSPQKPNRVTPVHPGDPRSNGVSPPPNLMTAAHTLKTATDLVGGDRNAPLRKTAPEPAMHNEEEVLERIAETGDMSDPLPDTNPKTAFGVTKTPMHLIPPPALYAEAEVMGLGAKKYGAYNWREHSVSASVYYAAALRHLTAYWEGENADPESGQSHLAHVRAYMGILLDAEAKAKLNDDRPVLIALEKPENSA